MYQAWQWPTAAAADSSYVQAANVPTVPTIAATANSTAAASTWPAVAGYGQYAVPNAVQPQWAWATAGQYGYAANMSMGQQIASQPAAQTSAYTGWTAESTQAPPPVPVASTGQKPPIPPPPEDSAKSGQNSKFAGGKITEELAPKDSSEDEKLKQLQAQAQQWTNQQQTTTWPVQPTVTAAAAMSGSLTTAAMSMPPPTQTGAQWPQATWNQGTWTTGQWQQPQQQWPQNWMQQQQSGTTLKADEVPATKAPELKSGMQQNADKVNDQAKSGDGTTKDHKEAIAALDKEEEEFDHQFQEWEKQFEGWKEQNINHPDKEAFASYERQWQEWREQLLKKKEQMSKKREEHLAALNKQAENANRIPDSSSQSTTFSTTVTTTSESIPGLDFQDEKTSSSGLTSLTTTSTVASTSMTTAAASITSASTTMTPTSTATSIQGTSAVSDPASYYPNSTQPQVPVPPQPYSFTQFMPPQPFMYPPNVPPPPPHVMQQQFPFRNTQAPPPPAMTGQTSINCPPPAQTNMTCPPPTQANLNCPPPTQANMNCPPPTQTGMNIPPPGPEMPPQKKPLLSTPGSGGLLPSPGSRFDNRPMDYNQMNEPPLERQQGAEEGVDQYGNEEQYGDRVEEGQYQDDWNYNEQNSGMNFQRGRGRGRGRGRLRGASRWSDNTDFEKPFDENMPQGDFESNVNPEGDFEGNMNAPMDNFEQGPPRNFEGQGNQPRGFEGNMNPPRGFGGNMNPRGFGNNMNPPRGFGGTLNPPRGFEGNVNPPRGFDGNMNAPRRFEGNMKPPRGFEENMNAPRPFGGNMNAPRGFEKNMNAPRGFEGNMNAPRGFEGNVNPPRGFEGNMNPPRDFDRNMNPPRDFDRNVNPSRGFDGGMNPPRNFDDDVSPPRKFTRNANAPRNFDRNMKPPMRFEGMPPRDFEDGMRPMRDFDEPPKHDEFYDRFKEPGKGVDTDAFNPDACLLSTKFPPDPPGDEKDMEQEEFPPDNDRKFPPRGTEPFGLQDRPMPRGRPLLRDDDRFPMDDPFGPRGQHPFDQPFEQEFPPGPPPFNERRFPGKQFRDMEPPRMRNERFPPDRFGGPSPFLNKDEMMRPLLDPPPFRPEEEPFAFGFPDERVPPKFMGDQGIRPFVEPEFGPDMRPPPFRDERFIDSLHSNTIDYTHRPAANVVGDEFCHKYDAFDQQFGSDLINYRDSYYMGHIPPPPPPIIFSQVDVQAFDYNHGKKPMVTSTIQGKKSSKDSKTPFSNQAVFDYAHRRERSPYRERERDRNFRDRDTDRVDRLRDHDRDKERGRDRDRNRDRDRSERDRDRGRDSEKDRDRDRHRDRDRDKDRDDRRDRDDRDRDHMKDKERGEKRSRWESREETSRNNMKDRSPESSNFRKPNGDRMRENKPQTSLPSSDIFKSESSSEIISVKDLIYPPNRFNRPKQLVIILRGLPGSGKTYVAKLIKDKELEHGGCAPRILSLDDYFMAEIEVTDTDPETGKKVKKKEFQYEYEACMEESYRASLLRSFKKTIDERFFPFIIVDAVHNESKHYEPMWSYAKQRGFQVYIAEMDCNDSSTCHKRNVHKRTLEDIKKIKTKWDHKPKHFLSLDIRPLLQDVAIPEVEMEDLVESDQKKNDTSNDDDNNETSMPFHVPSRWEKLEATEEKLDQLDGLRITKKKHSTMEDYLQLPDDYEERQCQPGKKRVRWADLEERKEQDRLRAIGFVVGQTDWSKLTDPTHADRALTRTKYI